MSGPLFSGPLIDILRQAPPLLAHQADAFLLRPVFEKLEAKPEEAPTEEEEE